MMMNTRFLLTQAEADTIRPTDLRPMFADFHAEEEAREWGYTVAQAQQEEAFAEWCQRQEGLS